MKGYRERFEEVWPVPDYATWCRSTGMYWYLRHDLESPLEFKEWNDRLDTFTRCQETTDVYASLIDEIIDEVEGLSIAAYGCVIGRTQDIIDRAQSLLDDKK